jgi:hypothetical protein
LRLFQTLFLFIKIKIQNFKISKFKRGRFKTLKRFKKSSNWGPSLHLVTEGECLGLFFNGGMFGEKGVKIELLVNAKNVV